MAITTTISDKSGTRSVSISSVNRSMVISDKAGTRDVAISSKSRTMTIAAKNDFDLSTVGTDSIEPLTDNNSLAILDDASNFIRK